jgi:hypothetical protein
MVDWVENGKAPDAIAAEAGPKNAYFPGRTRPLCAWPDYPRYRGSGRLEDASSFTCTAPAARP